ncbi:Pentatricopeptide repeat-containing protein [Drosera capensis]
MERLRRTATAGRISTSPIKTLTTAAAATTTSPHHHHVTSDNLTHFLTQILTPTNTPPRFNPQLYSTLFHHISLHRHLLHLGKSLHHHLLLHHLHSLSKSPQPFLFNHIINMYGKCGDLASARKVFDEMPERNVVSWTVLVSGYGRAGLGRECFRVFREMVRDGEGGGGGGVRPNEFGLAAVLSKCEGREEGREVHGWVVKTGFERRVFVANALIIMYSRGSRRGGSGRVGGFCSDGDEALRVFEGMEWRDLVTWNSMIAGFQIREAEVSSVLVKAYSDLGGEVRDCYKIFMDSSGRRDIVSWTGIIDTFAEQIPQVSLSFFCQLRRDGWVPDRYTLLTVLKACAELMIERHASAVHLLIVKSGFEDDNLLANALIHSYARCGVIFLSKKVFDELGFRDIISWNSVLKGYALHGHAGEALELFSRMDVKPDAMTFVSILSACSHVGMVEEGGAVFDSMLEKYGVVPDYDHYACMIDLFGRAGRIAEAMHLIKKMPMEPDSVIWAALLGACRIHNETELGKFAASKLRELDPDNSLGYVLMSNIFCSDRNFDDAISLWKKMKGSRVRKSPGLSRVEIRKLYTKWGTFMWLSVHQNFGARESFPMASLCTRAHHRDLCCNDKEKNFPGIAYMRLWFMWRAIIRPEPLKEKLAPETVMYLANAVRKKEYLEERHLERIVLLKKESGSMRHMKSSACCVNGLKFVSPFTNAL